MRRRRDRPVDREQRLGRGRVDRRAGRASDRRSPSCRRRSRSTINDSSAETSLRCASHRSTSPSSSTAAPAHSSRDDRASSASTTCASPSSSTSSRWCRCRFEVALGLDGVVQAQDGGRRAPLQDAPARVEPFDERREAERGTRVRRGAGWTRSRAPVMIPSVPSLPTNSCVRSGPTAARGAPPVLMARAVGEHDVESHDDVLDLPVARGELTGAAAREPPADGRQVDRLGPVPERHRVVVAAARPRAVCRTFRLARRRRRTARRRRRSRGARTGRARRRRATARSRRTRRCDLRRP